METTIDRYKILKSLNKGGMGEVFLAYDPLCKREVALKQILPELKHHQIIKERFLREAQIASRLTHPSIIPIFSIDPREDKGYYTMPYVEGETLKQILKSCLEEEKQGEIKHPVGSSILALTRIFLSICEAIAYTHSKGIVHRDLKPDNIIIGKYGQVLLLDWGLADWIGNIEQQQEEFQETAYKDLTRPGKVPGTLNYIAPERIRQEPSSVSIDIYSLGVMLYQLLTLRPPFQRTSVREYKKKMHLEQLIDPIERSPYREIPQHLNDIAKRCLRYDPQERFLSVDAIIIEIKSFLEGKPEWILSNSLNPELSTDWEFQENILLSQHTAITRSPDRIQWVSLMISKDSFPGNVRMQTRVHLSKKTKGVGLLLCIPLKEERQSLTEGICLFLSSESHLLLNQIEVLSLPGACIRDEKWHEICLEKIDQQIFIYLDGNKVGHYISRTPLLGTQVGLLCYDADFYLEPLKISNSSQNVLINCLAVPDAFLSYKNYTKARIEYQKIARSFAGRFEGREALFRAAITLIEEAKLKSSQEEKELLWMMALEEFGQLRSTPGAPLEYLGKSLVYKASTEVEEEIKCLELALRKYKGHPLVKLIEEQILLRLYETASSQRVAAYHFALLMLRHLPRVLSTPEHTPLLSSLKKHLEKSPLFLLAEPEEELLACELSFWLNKPITLVEIVETSASMVIISNALYGLMMLDHQSWAEENRHYLTDDKERGLVECALTYFSKGAKAALEALLERASTVPANSAMRCAYFIFDKALLDNKIQGLIAYFEKFAHTPFIDALHIMYCLKEEKLKEAGQLIESYPSEILHDEYSPLFIPMGCYLLCTETREIALSHFAGSIDLPYPPTSMLLGNYLLHKIHEKSTWMKEKALFWEKMTLWRQLALYYHCMHERELCESCFKELQNLKTLIS